MKKILTIILLSIFTIILTLFAYKSYTKSLQYEKAYIKYASNKTIEKNIQNQTKNLLNNLLSMILIDNTSKNKKSSIKKEMLIINEFKHETMQYFNYFIITFIISIFSYFFLNKIFVMAYFQVISLVSLTFGLTSPIFLMYITKDFGGSDVILQFESNSILSSIQKLFNQNNYFVGGIILLFSIIFPYVKTVLSLGYLFIRNVSIVKYLHKITSKMSKFSMTDVFVLSIFLVYLSPEKSGMIKTEIEIGFYFFFVYVMISLISSVIYNIKES